jgi:hypothetical protein
VKGTAASKPPVKVVRKKRRKASLLSRASETIAGSLEVLDRVVDAGKLLLPKK